MVNRTELLSRYAIVLLAAALLIDAALLRGAEYDEQYTLFLTAGNARPVWPANVFSAAVVAARQTGHASFAALARDLRETDVHPPLYFWAVSVWRCMFGPTLIAARMLSVVCGMLSIGLVGAIARRCDIRPAPAMLITLGCYGFVYTNAIARGFALAEVLTLCGVTLLLARRFILAGLCLGAACSCNYLAVFIAFASIGASGAWAAIPAAAPFLAMDAWFFIAQHASRTGQFPAFSLWSALERLGRYQGAAIFGGLPLYASGVWQLLAVAALGLVSVIVIVPVMRARPWAADRAIRIVLAAAIAPPVGLVVLGAVFNNTPIELRYLAFGLPFVALLLALPRQRGNWRSGLLLTTQVCGIAGLLLSPRTMQPARFAAADATRLAADMVVLVPSGNDGVGIVGAFGIEAAPATRILVVGPADKIADRLKLFDRVEVAVLAQDRDSITTLSAIHSVLGQPEWRRVAAGSNLEVFERSPQPVTTMR